MKAWLREENMVDPNDLWESLGFLSDDEPVHVLTRLYSTYEVLLQNDQNNKEAQIFFRNLSNAIDFCTECNLNRR
jgi:hypothetical protein